MQEGIDHYGKLESLMADPANKFLTDEIKRLREKNDRLNDRISSLPGRPNQWNPFG